MYPNTTIKKQATAMNPALYDSGSLSIGSKPVVSSNVGATPTSPTKIVPPKATPSNPLKTKLPPAGQQFVQNQTNSAPNGYYSQPSYNGSQVPLPEPTPAVNPPQNQLSSTDSAFAEYIKSLQPSSDVINAKTAYNDYVANQKTSISGLEGQGRGIPLTLVRGQQEKLLNQTQPEATRLQNEISIAQDSQKNIQEAGKAGLDYALNRESIKTAAEKQAYDRMTDKEKTAFDQKYKTDTLAQNKLEADRKFEEDKREFGLEYALKAKELDIKQQEANAKNSNATSPMQQSALTSANDLLTKFDDGIGTSAVGKSGFLGSFGYGLIPGTDRADFVTQFENFKSQADLSNVKYLKGQGAVSDAERKLLSNATKLDLKQSEPEFRKSLNAQIALMGGDVKVTLINPLTGESSQITTNKNGIEKALKDKLNVIY